MKAVRLSAHALSYTTRRGFTVAEVEDAIRTGAWQPADFGRLECIRDFPSAGIGTESSIRLSECGPYSLTSPTRSWS